MPFSTSEEDLSSLRSRVDYVYNNNGIVIVASGYWECVLGTPSDVIKRIVGQDGQSLHTQEPQWVSHFHSLVVLVSALVFQCHYIQRTVLQIRSVRLEKVKLFLKYVNPHRVSA